MRVLIDYRPALRHRTGVGEWVHSLVRALSAGQHTPTGNELFVVEGGANDLVSGGVTDPTIPAASIAGFVTDLYNGGGRHFLVPA